MNARSALIAVLLAGSVVAQEVVSPAAMTNVYGGANNAIPWGVPVPSTPVGEVFCQQIEDDLRGMVRVFKGFAFRHNYVAVQAAKTYVVTVKVGDAATASSGINATFASNWKSGGSQTIVFNSSVTFPAVPAYARPPAPPDAPLPFTTPHVYLGTDPLIWEVYIQNTTPSTPMHFHERGPGATHVAGMIGNGCVISGGTSPMGSSGQTTTAVLTDTLVFGPPSSAALLMIGNTADKLFGMVPLPFDLTSIGSPGCFVHINPLLNTPVATSASGGATFSLPFTIDASISGARLRTQWLGIDSQSLVRTSNGLDHSVPYSAAVGRPWPQNRVYASGFGPTPPATGAIQNNGIVTHWML